MSDLVRREAQDGVVTLTLNQPERRTPISEQPIAEALLAAIEGADRDVAVRAVMTGRSLRAEHLASSRSTGEASAAAFLEKRAHRYSGC